MKNSFKNVLVHTGDENRAAAPRNIRYMRLANCFPNLDASGNLACIDNK